MSRDMQEANACNQRQLCQRFSHMQTILNFLNLSASCLAVGVFSPGCLFWLVMSTVKSISALFRFKAGEAVGYFVITCICASVLYFTWLWTFAVQDSFPAWTSWIMRIVFGLAIGLQALSATMQDAVAEMKGDAQRKEFFGHQPRPGRDITPPVAEVKPMLNDWEKYGPRK